MAQPLVPLPLQPPDVAWPTQRWHEAPAGPEVDRVQIEKICDELFQEPQSSATGETNALVLVHRGRLVLERYRGGIDSEATLPSWSMAKSILHALVGILVRQGRLDIQAAEIVPSWSAEDPRAAITLDQMMRMVDGLEFIEDYIDSEVSSVIEMLFGAGKDDVAAYAEDCPLKHEPESVWNYSSGTANIVAGVLGRVVGGSAPEMERFMRDELFTRIGMTSAEPRFDAAGHFIGSSFVFATARDFARFGLLYLRDGCWNGNRILPEGWVDYARAPTAVSKGEYGALWWIAMDGSAVFHASGFRGQFIAIDPARDVVLVRLGDSSTDQGGAVKTRLRDLIQSFPTLAP